MAASWGMLLKRLEQSDKLRNGGSTTDDAKLKKTMDCSCSKTHSVFDNPKETDIKKEVIAPAEKTSSVFDGPFVFRAGTKKEFIPAKKTYPFFDKQKEASNNSKEAYTKNDAIDPAELIPLFPKK